MLVNSSSIMSAVLKALAFNIIFKMVVVSIIALMVIHYNFDQEANEKKNGDLKSTMLIATCGTLAFQLPVWLFNGLTGILVGVVAFWIVVTSILDFFFDIDYDGSYMLTGQIVGMSVLAWVIIGSTAYLLSLI